MELSVPMQNAAESSAMQWMLQKLNSYSTIQHGYLTNKILLSSDTATEFSGALQTKQSSIKM